MDQTIETI